MTNPTPRTMGQQFGRRSWAEPCLRQPGGAAQGQPDGVPALAGGGLADVQGGWCGHGCYSSPPETVWVPRRRHEG